MADCQRMIFYKPSAFKHEREYRFAMMSRTLAQRGPILVKELDADIAAEFARAVVASGRLT
jgi:hypothetical protein